jgi:hypothetical protein
MPNIVITLSSTATSIGTESDGSLVTQVYTVAQTLPVVNGGNTEQSGLSESDKIALGVGLGVGLPAFVIAILGYFRCTRNPVGNMPGTGLPQQAAQYN